MNKKVIKQIEDFIREKLDDFIFEHTLRVQKNALKIVKEEGGDKNLVEITALLHDVGSPGVNFEEHFSKSSETAGRFLESIKFDKKAISRIQKCIEAHGGPIGFVFSKRLPKTLEEKIVYDADMLELMGAFGILKIFFMGIKRRNFEFNQALERTKIVCQGAAKTLFTRTAKRMAKPLIKLQNKFFEQLEEQLS